MKTRSFRMVGLAGLLTLSLLASCREETARAEAEPHGGGSGTEPSKPPRKKARPDAGTPAPDAGSPPGSGAGSQSSGAPAREYR